MLQIVEAIRDHLTRNDGRLPESLDRIRELYVPNDPLTNQPFKYQLVDGIGRLSTPVILGIPENQSVEQHRQYVIEIANGEALLHAFLPHRFVDHTHANAILVLTDQPDPELHVRRALGDSVLVVPWIMPGFPLAKAVAEAYRKAPNCKGIVLLKHGLFTFGDTAKISYERTIALVEQAEQYLRRELGGQPADLGLRQVPDREPGPLALFLPQEGEERGVRSSRTPSGGAGLAECTGCGRCRPDWSSHWAS